MTLQRCFPLCFGSFHKAVSEEKILRNLPTGIKNCLWRSCLWAIFLENLPLMPRTNCRNSGFRGEHWPGEFRSSTVKSDKSVVGERGKKKKCKRGKIHFHLRSGYFVTVNQFVVTTVAYFKQWLLPRRNVSLYEQLLRQLFVAISKNALYWALSVMSYEI